MFDWGDLRLLLAAVDAGSLAGAARELGVQHSTVGRRLDALEEALGLRLFLRDRTGLTLTPAGERVAERAREMLRLAIDIERTAADPDDATRGTVRLTTSESFTPFLARRLAALHARHPELVVQVVTTNRRVDLLEREADIALRFMPTTEPGLTQRRVAVLGWSLYASRAYLAAHGRPADLDDLSGHRVVGFDTSMAYTPGATWLERHLGDARVAMQADSLVALVGATAMGIGIGALPCFMAGSEPELERLTPAVIGERTAWLVAHPDVARIPRVRTVMDWVVEMMSAEAALLSGG